MSLAVDPTEGKEVPQEKAAAAAQSAGGAGENPQAACEAGPARCATGQHQPLCNGQEVQVPNFGNLAPGLTTQNYALPSLHGISLTGGL